MSLFRLVVLLFVLMPLNTVYAEDSKKTKKKVNSCLISTERKLETRHVTSANFVDVVRALSAEYGYTNLTSEFISRIKKPQLEPVFYELGYKITVRSLREFSSPYKGWYNALEVYGFESSKIINAVEEKHKTVEVSAVNFREVVNAMSSVYGYSNLTAKFLKTLNKEKMEIINRELGYKVTADSLYKFNVQHNGWYKALVKYGFDVAVFMAPSTKYVPITGQNFKLVITVLSDLYGYSNLTANFVNNLTVDQLTPAYHKLKFRFAVDGLRNFISQYGGMENALKEFGFKKRVSVAQEEESFIVITDQNFRSIVSALSDVYGFSYLSARFIDRITLPHLPPVYYKLGYKFRIKSFREFYVSKGGWYNALGRYGFDAKLIKPHRRVKLQTVAVTKDNFILIVEALSNIHGYSNLTTTFIRQFSPIQRFPVYNKLGFKFTGMEGSLGKFIGEHGGWYSTLDKYGFNAKQIIEAKKKSIPVSSLNIKKIVEVLIDIYGFSNLSANFIYGLKVRQLVPVYRKLGFKFDVMSLRRYVDKFNGWMRLLKSLGYETKELRRHSLEIIARRASIKKAQIINYLILLSKKYPTHLTRIKYLSKNERKVMEKFLEGRVAGVSSPGTIDKLCQYFFGGWYSALDFVGLNSLEIQLIGPAVTERNEKIRKDQLVNFLKALPERAPDYLVYSTFRTASVLEIEGLSREFFGKTLKPTTIIMNSYEYFGNWYSGLAFVGINPDLIRIDGKHVPFDILPEQAKKERMRNISIYEGVVKGTTAYESGGNDVVQKVVVDPNQDVMETYIREDYLETLDDMMEGLSEKEQFIFTTLTDAVESLSEKNIDISFDAIILEVLTTTPSLSREELLAFQKTLMKNQELALAFFDMFSN